MLLAGLDRVDGDDGLPLCLHQVQVLRGGRLLADADGGVDGIAMF